MKLLFACLFMLVYLTIGFVLAILIGAKEFLKSIPAMWKGITIGKQLKKDLLSDEDMAEAFKGAKESLKTKKHEGSSPGPEDVGIWYGHKEGHD